MSEPEPRYSIQTLIVVVVATIIITVLALEMSGRIDHSRNKDTITVGEFRAINVKPGDSFRMSPKSGELYAVCQNGFIAVAAASDPQFLGLLVDYKNRGVRCPAASQSTPPARKP